MHRLLTRSLWAATAVLPVTWTSLASQAGTGTRSDTTTVRAYDGRSLPATRLTITVPERRSRPARTITVAALRLPSTAAHPGRPIVFLMGGPGIPGSVMVPIPPYFTLFERLRGLGDVIIVDQRGLGRSEPVLDCPFDAALPPDFFLGTERMVDPIRRQVAACAQRWRAQGADPSAYNSIESADDIDDLRRAMGADQIDLLAFSYGTRLALAVVQRHGAHVGRVVLQGVNGPGLVIKRPAPVGRKLKLLQTLLAQDSAWHGTSDLLMAARTGRQHLEREAATVTVSDRRSGQPVQLRVGRAAFDAIVALNLDDRRLPALLVSVAAGDDRVLTRFVEAAWNGLGGGTVGLMARAVNCAADRPEARWRVAAAEGATAPFGAPVDNAFLTDDFCRALGDETPSVEFSSPVRSAVPTLLLTGTLDATNPVENARDVAQYLPKAVLLEVENTAHEALPVPAVQDVVVDFLRGVDVRGRRITATLPHFPTVEEVLQAPPRRER